LQQIGGIEMSAGTTIHEPSVLIHKASWQTYVTLRDEDENRHVRMTYDRGRLELMSPTMSHERLGYLSGRCIDAWTEEREIPIRSCRSTTFRREDLDRGLEPDNCYYIAHEAAMRGKEEVDLPIDPPPDLAIEVDVHSSSLDRMSIYAALGVPEVWRWSREVLSVHTLTEKGQYLAARESCALPRFPFEQVTSLLERRSTTSETLLIREFREWVRRHRDDETQMPPVKQP
jgi:Uma2 family endonuclease